MTSRTLGNGYTITVSEHRNPYGETRWRYHVTSPAGTTVHTAGSFVNPESADRAGELAAKRAASPLYREPGTKGDA